MLHRSPFVSIIVGLVLLYIAERAFADLSRYILDVVGLIIFFTGVGMSTARFLRASGSRRQAAKKLLINYGLCVVAIVLYIAQLGGEGG